MKIFPRGGREPGRTAETVALASGLFLFAAFFGLTETRTGLEISYASPFTYSPPGEAYFWLASALLLFPGSCLIGFALGRRLAPAVRNAWSRAEGLNARRTSAALAILFVLAAGAARLSQAVILSDYPITDDEYATRFGGQILAMGKAKVPAFEPPGAFSDLFLYLRGGTVASIDWPGAQAAWAIAEKTRTGPLVFALAAGAAALAVAGVAAVGLSPGYGILAALLFLFSPMAFTLSATTHAQNMSRGLVGLTLLFYILAERRPRRSHCVLMGLAAGAAFSVRPVETAFLFFPLGLDFLFRTSRTRDGRLRLAAFGLGAAGPLVLFAVHNALLTGNPFVPPRFFMEGPAEAFFKGTLWNRFGANTSYNLFMLAVWFLGPLGLAAVAWGVLANRFTKLLGLGVLAMLGLGLLHDNHGLHIVGPIHYSECAVPLTIIAVHGLARLKTAAARAGFKPERLAAVVLSVLVFGLGLFDFWEARALHAQAGIQREIYGAISRGLDRRGVGRAVVLAPVYAEIWKAHPPFKKIGSWIWQWRRPRPDLSDRALIVHDFPEAAAAMRRRFPDRPQFRFSRLDRPPYFVLNPVPEERPFF